MEFSAPMQIEEEAKPFLPLSELLKIAFLKPIFFGLGSIEFVGKILRTKYTIERWFFCGQIHGN
jgi:hypothetical protein